MKQSDLDGFNIQTIQSLLLVTDSSVTPYSINWQPDYWIIVARLSAGYIQVYNSTQRGGLIWRIDKGTIRLPLKADVLTIETFAASGWYSLYPVRNLDGFDIKS